MKNIIFICVFIFNAAIASAQFAAFDFDKKTHKFKSVEEGAQLEHTFHFTNDGDIPLIITEYKVTCTCTKAIYSKTPIMPGEKSEIKVTFDTNGKEGWQYRTVSLYANTKKSPTEIEIVVKVKAASH